jgi:hypothetical protein
MSTLELNTYDLQRETAKIMGWDYHHQNGQLIISKKGEPSAMRHLWNPHSDIKDALEIVKKFTMKMFYNGVDWEVYTDFTSAGMIKVKHPDLCIAICLALIEHREVGLVR